MSTWATSPEIFWYVPRSVIVNGSQTHFDELEIESTFIIRTVNRTTQTGGSRIVGYVLELTLFIPQNRYPYYQADLLALQNEKVVDLDVAFHFFSPQEAPGTSAVLDAGMSGSAPKRALTLANLSCEGWQIENVERRMRLVVKFKGTYSVELFKSDVLPYFMNFTIPS